MGPQIFSRTTYAVVATLLGCAALYAYAENKNIHPPLRMPTKVIPYEPEKIIRMTLHEYKRGGDHAEHEVTGRYTEFGIPMKFVANASAYHEQVPLFFSTWMSWERDENGETAFVSVRDEEGVAPRSYVGSKIFRSNVTSAGVGGPVAVDNQFRGENLLEGPFPGFTNSVRRTKFYTMGEQYCGLDVFDHAGQRLNSRFLGPDQDPRNYVDAPLNIGRVFAYPAGSTEYTSFFICDVPWPLETRTGVCTAGGHLNEYVKYRVTFDSSMLCDAPDVVDAFDMFLREYSLEVE
ncbi:MAG: hypothetical protein AAGE80_14805 [Pseudomonadota bacterium]